MTVHCAPPLRQDVIRYFVLCEYKSGLAWAERATHNMSRKETLIDIRSGELPNVQQILECNPFEHICSDVTYDEDFIAAREANERTLQAAE